MAWLQAQNGAWYDSVSGREIWLPAGATQADAIAAAAFVPSQAHIAADAAVEAAVQRATATLPRADFLKACVAAGLMTSTEAVTAAKGDWPATLLPLIAGLSQQEQDNAMIDWAAAVEVRRNSPLVAILAAGLSLDDAALDALFGV